MKKTVPATVTIYHNPRCSKSRAALALLEEQGIEPVVVDYLTNPPSATELKRVLSKLKLKPLELMRKGEEEFKAHVEGKPHTDAQLIAIMVAHPKLIERPIVVRDDRAVIGRPPEAVLSLLK